MKMKDTDFYEVMVELVRPYLNPNRILKAYEFRHKPPQLKGYVWFCGDEECNCSQANIIVEVPSRIANQNHRYDVILIEEGEYYSGCDTETGCADADLRALCKKYNLVYAIKDMCYAIKRNVGIEELKTLLIKASTFEERYKDLT